MKRKSCDFVRHEVQDRERDDGLTELQRSIIREQEQMQQQCEMETDISNYHPSSSGHHHHHHRVPSWYAEEERMFFQQEDEYFENQRRENRPKLAVIICDDNEVNLKILTRLFSKVFFREVKVIACRDGLEAIEAYKSLNTTVNASHLEQQQRRGGDEEITNNGADRLAMIVMDFEMPKCDGLSACKYIRAMEKFAQEEENAMMNQSSPPPPFEQKYFEKIPILMFTTEFHMVLPALIEGIVDDRLAKPCSCKDFILTVHKHMPNFILEEYADLLVPLGESNALLKRKYASEACLSGMANEGTSNLDSDVSAMSTDNGVLERANRSGSGSSSEKKTPTNTEKEDACFYDVAEGDISAGEEEDEDVDDDIQHKHNMREAKKNARWNLFSFSPKRRKDKGKTEEKKGDDGRVDANNSTQITTKRRRGNNNITIVPNASVTGGKKRLSLDSYIRACRKVWTQTKSRLGGMNNRSNRKEKQTRAYLVVKNKASTPELSTFESPTRNSLQYYQSVHRNGVYDTM